MVRSPQGVAILTCVTVTLKPRLLGHEKGQWTK
jgi:hypothetical protein